MRIAEQLAEYLQSGIAINAVNMPALSPEQYQAIEPYIALAEKLGAFAAQIATGNPTGVRLVYLRQAGRGQHAPDPQRRPGRRAEPVALARRRTW